MNSPTLNTTTIPRNSLPAQLQQIGLRAVPTQLDDFLARATKAHWSPHQILEQLVQAEIAERSRRSLERRLRLSGLKRFKPMADFEWGWPLKIEREVIDRAFTLDFVPEARNVILLATFACLAVQLIPVAPPRLIPGHVVVDTPLLYGQSVYGPIGQGFSDQYSAMPSVHIAWSSAVAFFISEIADLAVYTPLARRRLIVAVLASSVVGLVVDSIVFLWLAFGSLDFLLGQVVGKAWMVLASIPFVHWLRRRDERLGIAPV